MNDLFQGFEFICAYIDDILMFSKGDWIDNLQKLYLTLNKLKESGLKCNIGNYLFGITKIEYLGLWVTQYGVKNIDKIEANLFSPPTFWK